MTTTLPVGRPFEMAQDVTYALPGRTVRISVDGADTLETANEDEDSAFAAVTLDTNGNAELSQLFVRCTTGTPIVSIK